MAITLGSNISSLKAQRALSINSSQLDGVFQRLASGSRINKASDDAAGLAIADSLKADQRVATVAIRNANDGISTIAIADAALGEIGGPDQQASDRMTAIERLEQAAHLLATPDISPLELGQGHEAVVDVV